MSETETTTRASRKTRDGVVTSDAMDKTVVVTVTDRVRHARYNKFVVRTKKLHAHDETNDAHVGAPGPGMETRPLSKNKRWRVIEILERAR
ncbi:MAG: 30S ribosomal protein S17 [Ilumatobacteraceae bacterium]